MAPVATGDGASVPPPGVSAAVPDAAPITNQTALRLAVRQARRPGEGAQFVVIPPFATHRGDPSLLDPVELGEWQRRGLLKPGEPEDDQEEDQPPFTLGAAMLSLLVAGGLVYGAWLEGDPAPPWSAGVYWRYWAAAVVVGGLLLTLYRPGNDEHAAETRGRVRNLGIRAGPRLRRLGFPLATLTAFGLPLLVYANRAWAVRTDGAPPGQGPALEGAAYAFAVGMLTLLPAFFHYLFLRQQGPYVRHLIRRSIVRLDPGVRTLDDAEERYGPLFPLIKRNADRSATLLIDVPALLCTLCIALGWIATLIPKSQIGAPARAPVLFVGVNDGAMAAGFLGAYFFLLNLLFRRYMRGDLNSKAYVHVVKRLFVTLAVLWAFGLVAAPAPASLAHDVMIAAAFVVGVLPDTGVIYVFDVARKLFGSLSPTLQERRPLSLLEGVTPYDSLRLLEEGVENVESLAHFNLVNLIVRTRIEPSRLVDLVDQAVLVLHTAPPGTAPGTSPHGILCARGIRTATDLLTAEAAARANGPDAHAAFLRLLGPADGTPVLRTVIDALRDDEWVLQLRHWHALDTAHRAIFTIEDIRREERAAMDYDPPHTGLPLS